MSHKPFRWIFSLTLGLILFFAVGGAVAQGPVGTAFTYQGHLISGIGAVNSTCDFEFKVFDSPLTTATQISSTQAVPNVNVTNGLFTVQLDFGVNVFTGGARWLEVAVRCPAGAGAFTPLAPRQELTPAPYALYATSAGSASEATNLDVTNQLTVGGNVGIGTMNPVSRLHIKHSGIRAVDGLLLERSDATNTWFLVNSNDNKLHIAPGPSPTQSGAATMVLTDVGNVGIGMTSPTGKLHINGSPDTTFIALQTNTSTSWNGMHIDWVYPDGQVVSRITTENYGGGWGDLVFYTRDQPTGTTDPTVRFGGNGNVYAPGGFFCDQTGNCWSDERLKNNVIPLSNTLDKVEQLRGISFEWNNEARSLGISEKRRQIGLVAQEVEAVFPELVYRVSELGYKGINYDRLPAVLIEAIKELRVEKDNGITALKAENAALEKRIIALEQAASINGGNLLQLPGWNFAPPTWWFFSGLLVIGIAVAWRRN